jgi:anaerobic ribonucleoside-triphosphate reductase activating protein
MADQQQKKPALNIHHIDPASRANGPGTRFTVWVQGCSLACPGCFNPKTHSKDVGQLLSKEELLWKIQTQQGITLLSGVTVSGGEPLEQAEVLFSFVRAVQEQTELTVLLYSGYTLEQIRNIPNGRQILSSVDGLIAGPYRRELATGSGLLGSSNQKIHLFTQRIQLHELENMPQAEVRIRPDGVVEISGHQPMQTHSDEREVFLASTPCSK